MYDQPYNPFAKNLAAVKEYFKTSSVPILAVCQVVSSVFSVIGVILLSTKSKELLAYLRSLVTYISDEVRMSAVDESKLLRLVDNASVSDVNASVFSSIPAVLVTVLIAAAFFIIYLKSRSADPGSSPMTGFTILYVFAIITLVVTIIATVAMIALIALMFVAYAMLASGSNESFIAELRSALQDLPFIDGLFAGEDSTTTAYLIIVISLTVFSLVALFFALFTAINKMRYYKSVRNSLSSVELQNKGAGPYGVMCIFTAIGTGCSLFSCVTLLFPPHLKNQKNPFVGVAILFILSLAASLVASIMEAKLALGYKQYIDNVKYGYNTPAAPAAPYAPFAPAPGFAAPPQNNPYVRNAPAAPKPIIGFGDAPDLSMDNAYSDPFGADNMAKSEAPADEMWKADPPVPEPAAVPTCPLCGEEVEPGAPFCGNCGNRL